MISATHGFAEAVPAARPETSASPRDRRARRSAPQGFACGEEAEESYRAARSWPVVRASIGRRAGPDRAARAGTLAGDRAGSTYPVERSLLQADGLALSLRSALDRIAPLLARAAAAFVRTEAWSAFGFARPGDHARERFGRSGRWLKDLAALGDALSSRPGLSGALSGEDGGPPIGRVAALLIGRAADRESLPAWIVLARAVSVRELREAVRRARAAGSAWPPGRDAESERADAPQAPAVTGEGAGHSGAASRAPEASGDESIGPCAQSAGSAEADAGDDGPADRSLVRVPVPAPLVAAFDETVDLFRAVEGSQASLTSFVEALVGESLAGMDLPAEGSADFSHAGPPDVSPAGSLAPSGAAVAFFYDDCERVALRRGPDVARVESALARSTGRWRHLARSSSASWALHLAGAGLARLGDLSRSAGSGGPADLDAQIRDLLVLENDLERRLGGLLAEMAERGAWPRLRFAGAGHYAEERLGLSRTFAEDRARAARSLRRFPLLRAAYDEGRVGLEATLTSSAFSATAPSTASPKPRGLRAPERRP